MTPGITRAADVRRGVRLEYFTIGYNSLEAAIALIAGLLAGSVALVGFGLDSVVEVTSGAALLWRLHGDTDASRCAIREAWALKAVGFCFLALAAYVAYEAGESLVLQRAPARSPVGIALAAISLVVMPFLARAKRGVASRISSAAMHADSRQTDFCAYLSAILLAGLLLNALAGWWWADPLAGLAMVPIVAREGWNALRGRSCSGCGCS
uniref:Integral membrane protein n=1 Tax=Solibacter usitatus (strain Ellin6076) TaxID=234267 RepID=Q01ZS9_SOLUE